MVQYGSLFKAFALYIVHHYSKKNPKVPGQNMENPGSEEKMSIDFVTIQQNASFDHLVFKSQDMGRFGFDTLGYGDKPHACNAAVVLSGLSKALYKNSIPEVPCCAEAISKGHGEIR